MTPLNCVIAILKLKARRRMNMWMGAWTQGFRKKKQNEQKRAGTGRKRTAGWFLLSLIMFAVFMFQGIFVSKMALSNIAYKMGGGEEAGRYVAEQTKKNPESARNLIDAGVTRTGYYAPRYFSAVAFVAALLFCCSIFLALGSWYTDLERLELDVEFLLSLPVSVTVIYSIKIIEKTFLNFFGLLVICPFYGMVLYYWEFGWWLVPAAIALTLVTNCIAGIAEFLIVLFVRRFIAPNFLKTVQATFLILSTVTFLAVFSLVSPIARTDYFLYDCVRAVGSATEFLPFGLGLGIFYNKPAFSAVILAAELFAIGSVAWFFISLLSRRGLEAVVSTSQVRVKGIKLKLGDRIGILDKDWKMVTRDPRLLIELCAVPAIVVLAQLVFDPEVLQDMISDPLNWSAVSFGLGVYSLMISAPRSILHEGDALWMFFSFPQPLDRIAFKKAWVWIGAGLIISSIAFAAGVMHRGFLSGNDVVGLVWILVGLPIFGLIGGALGILGADPLAPEMKDRMQGSTIYLNMLLGGMITGGLFLPGAWQKMVCLIIFATLALALWQRVSARIYFLLDPTAVPARGIELMDGLVAVVLFFFIQTLASIVCLGFQLPIEATLAISYVSAGALTAGMMFYALWREGVKIFRSMRFVLFEKFHVSLGKAVAAGAVVSAIGIAYMWAILKIPEFKKLIQVESGVSVEIMLIAIVAAPFFEEIIFRGFVFTGLRQIRGFFFSAVASALFFAIVHPQVSVVPLFCVGIATAWVYESTGALMFPMIVHMLYNAAVTFAQ